jgi:hypothetical protein
MSGRDDDLMRGRTAGNGAPADGQKAISPTELIRARQRSRARIMALLLGGFVLLVFAISVVKITQGHGP